MALAGFSDAEADGLRKVMSKKDRRQKLADYRERFVAGARGNGVPDDKIKEVWAMMMSFSGYSFCKPHSASYARVSFQAAYLKVHFPAEFMAAVISNQGGFYSTFAYVSEARRLGVTVLSPDVQRSRIRWWGRDSRIRVGLMAVKGLSAGTMDRVLAQREKAPFGSLHDFLIRVRPAGDEARDLVHSGALDSLAPGFSRGQLLWQLTCLQNGSKSAPDAPTLFESPQDVTPPLKLPPDDELMRLRREFEVLGILCGCHPMALFASAISKARTVKAAQLPRYLDRKVRFAGWLITGKVVHTKRGDPMEFLTFEDDTGVVETTFFPKAYDRFCHLLDRGRPFLLDGLVEQNWGAVTLTVSRVRPLVPPAHLSPTGR
jgi:DNA polymerase-3 subunit alpha/error-prone DNA polymerase